ncbi:hypothetical protein COO60DRAFT_1496874 [Scenedesmus sp. NREL 46B-D3]|nr:hypothetical protein COO60DRAFT_1496874 [Scenedesmus sp. NREL 46B-D3]
MHAFQTRRLLVIMHAFQAAPAPQPPGCRGWWAECGVRPGVAAATRRQPWRFQALWQLHSSSWQYGNCNIAYMLSRACTIPMRSAWCGCQRHAGQFNVLDRSQQQPEEWISWMASGTCYHSAWCVPVSQCSGHSCSYWLNWLPTNNGMHLGVLTATSFAADV